jgi:nucleotide-binding universal stress UspA family protein
MFPLKKILCPTDFSEPSLLAINAATELAEISGAEIILVHAVPPPSPLPASAQLGTMVAFDTAAYLQGMLTYGRESMKRLIEEKIPDKVRVRSLVLAGSPSDEITRAAENEHVDLVVIATHGLTGWKRFIFGSVAERVVRLAPCPVLTIPAPGKDKE